MKFSTPYLPGFSHRLCGRRAGAVAATVGAHARRLDGLAALVAHFIPAATLATAAEQRDRIFNPWVTFIVSDRSDALLTDSNGDNPGIQCVTIWR